MESVPLSLPNIMFPSPLVIPLPAVLPIAMLSEPVVRLSADCPIAIFPCALLAPVVPAKVPAPIAMFSEPDVIPAPLFSPIEMLRSPVDKELELLSPMATLLAPEELLSKAPSPTPILSRLSAELEPVVRPEVLSGITISA